MPSNWNELQRPFSERVGGQAFRFSKVAMVTYIYREAPNIFVLSPLVSLNAPLLAGKSRRLERQKSGQHIVGENKNDNTSEVGDDYTANDNEDNYDTNENGNHSQDRN